MANDQESVVTRDGCSDLTTAKGVQLGPNCGGPARRGPNDHKRPSRSDLQSFFLDRPRRLLSNPAGGSSRFRRG